jgi:hypothetical protein
MIELKRGDKTLRFPLRKATRRGNAPAAQA